MSTFTTTELGLALGPIIEQAVRKGVGEAIVGSMSGAVEEGVSKALLGFLKNSNARAQFSSDIARGLRATRVTPLGGDGQKMAEEEVLLHVTRLPWDMGVSRRWIERRLPTRQPLHIQDAIGELKFKKLIRYVRGQGYFKGDKYLTPEELAKRYAPKPNKQLPYPQELEHDCPRILDILRNTPNPGIRLTHLIKGLGDITRRRAEILLSYLVKQGKVRLGPGGRRFMLVNEKPIGNQLETNGILI